MRRSQRVAALLAVVTLLGACTLPGDEPSPGSDAEAAEPDASEPDAPAQDDAPQEPPGADDPDGDAPDATDPGGAPDEAQLCDADDRAGVEATITGQLEAFADDDLEAARAFASRRFQEATDLPTFRDVIVEGYPLLLDDAVATLGRCVRVEETVQVVVEVVTASDERDQLAYALRQEAGQWRIDGAVRLGAADPGGLEA
ncbi:MAG: DUF4864 domain-containing protein [Nitriliruptoraceae bacterium]|nr:DUF4864 domain-containing protein [Nitriliruptoraceae bacterium]